METLLFDIHDGVARITLNRPDVGNALNAQMARELLEVALVCDEDSAVRAVLLRGHGRMFCAGGDLGSFTEAGTELPRLIKEMTVYLHAAIGRFARMSAPVVAAVGGPAAGAGFSLACAADLVVASSSARFTMAYTRAGLTPDGSSTWFLPRLIGRRRTLELMLTNRTLSAEEARDWGLVNQVVDDEALPGASEELVSGLAAGPTLAFGRVKELVMASAGEGLETQMEHEARGIADASRTEDAKEGITAFFEKRAPEFRGA